MSSSKPYPGAPVENLAIGKIIEVNGSRIIAELDPSLTELSRVYGGEAYPIGQFGSTVRIHHGRRIIFAFVARLRMKADYEAERGITAASSADERQIVTELRHELRNAGHHAASLLLTRAQMRSFISWASSTTLLAALLIRFIASGVRSATV